MFYLFFSKNMLKNRMAVIGHHTAHPSRSPLIVIDQNGTYFVRYKNVIRVGDDVSTFGGIPSFLFIT